MSLVHRVGDEGRRGRAEGAEGLTEAARRFLARDIDSVEGLEVLLLLHGAREKSWSAEGVARELGISAEAAARRLEELSGKGLLDVRIAQDLLYRFAPAREELAREVDELAEAYASRRIAILNLIMARPPSPVRDFSEAFRFKKKKEES